MHTIHAVMDWLLCPPKLVCCDLTPKVMIFGGRVFGRWLGHELGPSWRGLVFIGPRKFPRPFGQVSGHWKDISLRTRKQTNQTQICQHLGLDLRSLQNCEKYICCSYATRFMAFFYSSPNRQSASINLESMDLVYRREMIHLRQAESIPAVSEFSAWFKVYL